MKSTKEIFQALSYLNYLFIGVAIYFVFSPIWNGLETFFESFNNTLMFLGLSVTFSTLQDTGKTQNELSRKVWQDPKKGKSFLIFIGFMAFFFLLLGFIFEFFIQEQDISGLGTGMMILGISMVAMLKAAEETFENHRKDKAR